MQQHKHSDVSLVGRLSGFLELCSKDRNRNRYQNPLLSYYLMVVCFYDSGNTPQRVSDRIFTTLFECSLGIKAAGAMSRYYSDIENCITMVMNERADINL